MKIATFEATPNIAVIKYWGKRDEQLVLPTNSSISMTLDSLKTRTTVLFDEALQRDELWLNGKAVDLERNAEAAERLKQLEVIRQKTGIKTRAKIVSINGFPTGAGFASSASGLAALACAASKAAGLKTSAAELSILARLGSGSASRSVLGGFVEWRKGEKKDGSDSIAVQLAGPEHWREMRVVSAVVNGAEKKVSSRAGMKQTVETSKLFKARLQWVESAVPEMESAIKNRDFEAFARITIQDSNNLHAVMLDTFPPIVYMNDTSHELVYAVNTLNKQKVIAAYTFDAGPNCHIYTLESDTERVVQRVKETKGVKRIIVSKPGKEPVEVTDPGGHLIDPATGETRRHNYDETTNNIVVQGR